MYFSGLKYLHDWPYPDCIYGIWLSYYTSLKLTAKYREMYELIFNVYLVYKFILYFQACLYVSVI